ncbi:hypothetical protein BH23CHL2_BH23CHL2_20230 [soil metagenome]
MSGVALTVIIAASVMGLTAILLVLLIWLDQRRQ